MTIDIRQYRSADLDAILNVWEQATRLAHSFMTDAFIGSERQNIIDIYIPNTDTWVADINGEVVGFISLMGNEVGALFLEPKLHGNGYGAALMNKAHVLHGQLEVEVFKVNHIGRRFYDRYGFQFMQESLHEPTGQLVWRLRLGE